MGIGNALSCLIRECNVFFEGSLISREMLLQKYVDFLASGLTEEKRFVSIALHTGSICFDALALLVATLGCLALDLLTPDKIIEELSQGDIVLYKNERHRWCGLEKYNGEQYFVIEQDGRGNNGSIKKRAQYNSSKHLIQPYYGTSELTDGRGIRRPTSSRSDFLSLVLGIPPSEVPSVAKVSAVIVSEQRVFDRISRGLNVVYDADKHIDLLDIATASWYSDSGEEYPFGNNPARVEPVLKVTGKVSTARDLVLDKSGSKIVGLLITSSDALTAGKSEVDDLLDRESLSFAHVTISSDSESSEELVRRQDEIPIFACTKEFLLQNSLPLKMKNALTTELDRQVANVINSSITVDYVERHCLPGDIRKLMEGLFDIMKSNWEGEPKNRFIIIARSLLKLFSTATFPMQDLEKAIDAGMLHPGVISPAARINELWDIANDADTLMYQCATVADILECLYKALFSTCPKLEDLTDYLETRRDKKIMIVVPKAYYTGILATLPIANDNVSIIAASHFNDPADFEEIIVVGDFFNRRFDPLRCQQAKDLTVFLYDYEMPIFARRKRKRDSFEKALNARIGIVDGGWEEAFWKKDIESNQAVSYVDNVEGVEKYAVNIDVFNRDDLIFTISASTENVTSSEIFTVGGCIAGEQVFFSKYYSAVVYDPVEKTVVEKSVEDLLEGDLLIFARRDSYTQNMVDYVYREMLSASHLRREAIDAAEKALYWKEALREYRTRNGLSYSDIAERLQALGSSLQEATIRQWLAEDSHVVGPRSETSLVQVANLTCDPHLLADVHSYFEACRITRHHRKEILDLISEAVVAKLEGRDPEKGGILDTVYENVDNLFVMIELEDITVLDTPISVPLSLVNRPITKSEVSA